MYGSTDVSTTESATTTEDEKPTHPLFIDEVFVDKNSLHNTTQSPEGQGSVVHVEMNCRFH